VVDAIKRQAELATHTCIMVVGNEPYIDLAERLNALTPVEQPAKTIFANSGAEAVENAVKIARYATGRSGVAVVEHAFHGRTIFAMTMTAKPVYSEGFGPPDPSVYRLPFAYPYRCPAGASPEDCGPACADLAIARMREIGPETLACFVVEPILGEGGFVVPAAGYLPRLHEFCAEHGILFVADEVQTGMGRTGKFFAYQHDDVDPDIVTVAKTLSGGFVPVGATMAKGWIFEKVYSSMDRVLVHDTTYGSNAAAMAAGLATLAVIDDEQLVGNAERTGAAMKQALQDLAGAYEMLADVRGRGLMIGFEFGKPSSLKLRTSWNMLQTARRGLFAQMVVVAMFERHHVLTQVSGDHMEVIKLLPTLTIGMEEVTMFTEAFADVMKDAHRGSGLMWDFGRSLVKQAVTR
jgi:ornithine--oxo-acid transaminase